MPSPKRIRTLVVEDDAGMRDFYARFFARLEPDGYSAVFVDCGESALEVLKREPVDIVVLDWALPGISGETLLRAMREHPTTRSIGVLMVTGKSAPEEEIQALDFGADDHLAKPFDENVLQARLRSLCRRRELMFGGKIASRYKSIEFDPAADMLRIDGHRVNLTPREMGLLAIFLNNPNVVQPRAYLWEALWGYESSAWEDSLLAAIESLRRNLGAEWGARLKPHADGGFIFEYPL